MRVTVPPGTGGVLIAMALCLCPQAPDAFMFSGWSWRAPLNYVNGCVQLSLVFYLLFFPYNLLARTDGARSFEPPENRPPKLADSPQAGTRQDKERFERLF